jgi:hypothetical protein
MPFDAYFTGDSVVIRSREPSARRCGCCDKCPHVERYYEEVHSFAEAEKRGWLVKTNG